jgi:hypothetical protein
MSRVYIAGPMTGLPEYNYPAFHAAAARFRATGREVENPAETFGGDTTRPYEEYLGNGLAQLVRCNAIALLPGWEKSKGARIELGVAASMGMDVFDAVTMVPMERPKVLLWWKPTKRPVVR